MYLRNEYDIRVERESIFGNPFYMELESQRNYVCDKYEEYFKQRVKSDSAFKYKLDKLIELYKKPGKLNLFCLCYPKWCHSETIKAYILREENTE